MAQFPHVEWMGLLIVRGPMPFRHRSRLCRPCSFHGKLPRFTIYCQPLWFYRISCLLLPVPARKPWLPPQLAVMEPELQVVVRPLHLVCVAHSLLCWSAHTYCLYVLWAANVLSTLSSPPRRPGPASFLLLHMFTKNLQSLPFSSHFLAAAMESLTRCLHTTCPKLCATASMVSCSHGNLSCSLLRGYTCCPCCAILL